MSRVPSNSPDDDFAVEITSLDTPETSTTASDRLLQGSRLAPKVRVWLTILSIIGGILLLLVVLTPILSSLLSKKTATPPVLHLSVQVRNMNVQNGIAYVSSSDGMWRAFRVRDGFLLWQRKLPEVTPVFVQNIMYMYYYDQQFYTVQALRASDGKLLWTFKTTSSTSIPVILANGVANALSDGPYNQGLQQGQTLLALDSRTGSKRWQYNIHTPYSSNVFVQGMQGKVYLTVASNDQPQNMALFVLRSSDGLPLWHYNTPANQQSDPFSYTPNFSFPLATNGLIYLTPANGSIQAFNADNGHEVWHYNPPTNADSVEPLPTMGTTLFYVQTAEGPLKALRADNGTLAWTYKDPWGIATIFAETDGVLYCKTSNGFLVALRASDGKRLWRVQPISPPFTVDSLYIKENIGYTFTRIGNATGVTIAALRLSDGTRLWQRKIDVSNSMIFPQMSNSQLFVDFGDTITALRASDGTTLWHANTVQSDLQYGLPLTIAGQFALLHLSTGVLEVRQMETGALLWRFPR